MEGAREQQEWGHGRAKDATHEEIRCTACGTLFTTTTKLRQHLQFSACVPVHGHTSMQRREDEGGVRPSENWSFNLLLAAAHSRTVQGVPRDAVNSFNPFPRAGKPRRSRPWPPGHSSGHCGHPRARQVAPDGFLVPRSVI